MKKFLSVVMALAMTLTLVTVGASAKDFTDDSKITYNEAVDVISTLGVVDGYTDGSFNPSATLTRGAAAKIICNMILGPTTAGALGVNAAPFSDVPVSNVFAGYIAYCSQQGIINGYGDGTFKPTATVTGYQFMKMLLGALGYDGSVEGFTGANWTVAVAKLAVSIGLDDGNDSFVGSKAMTREEAALYAFNTLKATMVSYDTTGTTIVVGGTTITQGASKAADVANKASTETIKNDDLMQFAEKYFSNLKLASAATDAFGRPASTWTYKNTKVGTYADTADLTYTASVKMGTLYTDLGLSEKASAADVTTLRNNAPVASFDIAKGETTNKVGGNGVLTEVYKLEQSDGSYKYKVIMIDTFVGEVQSVKAATSSADRSITLSPISGAATALSRVGKTIDNLTSYTATYAYDTDSFATEDIVSYTAALNDSNQYEVQSVSALATTATGTLTAYTSGSSMVVGGTTYKNSANMGEEDGSALTSSALKNDMDVYADAYGYALYVASTSTTTNYAVVLGVGSSNTYGDTSSGVTLLLADGSKVSGTYNTTKSVTLTATPSVDGDLTLSNNGSHGKIVTYTTDSDGVYTLKEPAVATSALASLTTAFVNGKSAITFDNGTHYYYTTSATVFGIRTGTAGNYTYSTYTGYANAPSFSGAARVSYVLNDAGQVKAVFVEGATVTGTSSTTTFIVKSTSDVTTDSNDSYYVLNAVVDGQVTTLNVSTTATNGLSSIDTDGKYNTAGNIGSIYTLSNLSTDTNDIVTSGTTANTSQYPAAITGTKAAANGVVGFGVAGGYTYYAYDSDTLVFYINSDGTISASSVGAIGTDTDDIATVVLSNDTNNSTLSMVFIRSK